MEPQPFAKGEFQRQRVELAIALGQLRHRFTLIIEGDQTRRDQLCEPLPIGGERQPIIETIRRRFNQQRDAWLGTLGVASDQ